MVESICVYENHDYTEDRKAADEAYFDTLAAGAVAAAAAASTGGGGGGAAGGSGGGPSLRRLGTGGRKRKRSPEDPELAGMSISVGVLSKEGVAGLAGCRM